MEGNKRNTIKNNIDTISIEARANNSTQGYVYLQYSFTNDEICQEEIEGAKKVPFKQSVQSPLVRGFYILMFNGGLDER